GAAFAFAPFRLEQDGHMQVISSGGFPLALALGVRGYRLRRPRCVIAGSVVAAWQLTVGFSVGRPFAYLLAALAVMGAIVWLRRGLAAGVVVVSILALGFRPDGGILWPYRILYDVLPGLHAIRVPGRLVTISSLGLALLAGAGAQRAMLGGPGRALSRWGGGT